MFYESFHARFPEIAEKETRTITIIDKPGLPRGSFGLLELYCNEPGCDCRRVFLDVYDWQKRKSMAVIAYGWEGEEFYTNWFKYSEPTPEVIRDMKGPVVNPSSLQSKYAPAFLELVTGILAADPNYVTRLQRHYRVFKEAVDHEPPLSESTSGPKERIEKPKRKRITRRGRR